MTQAIPVAPATLAGKSWHRSSSYKFAADKIICPIDITEVSKASTNMPLAFLKTGQGFLLVAVNGLLQDQNLYVDAAGRWLADYVPLEYRLHPFLIAQTEDERSVLCIDEDSGLVSDSDEGLPFFQDNEPTELVGNILSALSNRHTQRQQTQKIVQRLADAELLKEWKLEFKINNEDRQLDGLYCIDEIAIASLSGEQLVTLRDCSALALIYCQMLSMHQVQYLLKLLQSRPSAQGKPVSELNLDGFASDSGTLSFDNL